MDESIADQVVVALQDEHVNTVMVPVNFNGVHWCAIVVKKTSERIYYFDSCLKKCFTAPLTTLCVHLQREYLKDYSIVQLNTPCQNDEHTCGVLVYWVFIRNAISGASSVFTEGLLTARRFELSYYVHTGRHDVLLARQKPVARSPLGAAKPTAHVTGTDASEDASSGKWKIDDGTADGSATFLKLTRQSNADNDNEEKNEEDDVPPTHVASPPTGLEAFEAL